jgi:hypothetical protein
MFLVRRFFRRSCPDIWQIRRSVRVHTARADLARCAASFQELHACVWTRARARARARPVRACTRGCVGACNAREMRRTTIQILLLLLREQSPVNRPPRHNVSIQVRSAVLNRSGSLGESRKSSTGPAPPPPPSILRCPLWKVCARNRIFNST